MARPRRARRTVVVGTVAVVILAAAGVGAYAATRPGGHDYRTGLVTTAAVTRTLQETGTAAPEAQATASFAQSGTVATVPVRVGQSVTAGQTLATLDTTTLVAALDQAKQATAEAALTLTEAADGTLPAGSGSGSGGSRGGSANPAVATGTATVVALSVVTSSAVRAAAANSGRTGGSSGGTSAMVTAVTAGQHRLDTDLTAARTLVGNATSACGGSASPGPSTSPSTSTSTSTSVSPSTSTSASTSASPSPSSSPASGAAACLSAEQAALAEQQRVATDEATLAAAESTLDSALSKAASSTGAGSSTGSGRGGTTGGSGSSGTSTTVTVTAAQLAAYQAKLDAATAAQAVAQQDLDLATLVSPISGTVLSVGLTAGTAAGSGAVVVSAPSGVVFTTDVPVTTVPEVAVGQQVSVLRDGTATPLAGKVVAVAAAPDSSGDYAVTVGVAGQPAGIRSGSTASMTLSLATTGQVLTVPTSALRSVGTRRVVEVLTNSTVTVVPVTVGTQGALRTQVSGSLKAGQHVVLADLAQPVPASNEDSTTRGGLGATTGLGGGGATSFGGRTGGGTRGRG